MFTLRGGRSALAADCSTTTVTAAAGRSRSTLSRVSASAYVDADYIVTGHTHDSWQVRTMKVSLNDANRVEHRTIRTVKCTTYKDEYGQGEGGFHIETGKPPKPLGAWWLVHRDGPKAYRRVVRGGVACDSPSRPGSATMRCTKRNLNRAHDRPCVARVDRDRRSGGVPVALSGHARHAPGGGRFDVRRVRAPRRVHGARCSNLHGEYAVVGGDPRVRCTGFAGDRVGSCPRDWGCVMARQGPGRKRRRELLRRLAVHHSALEECHNLKVGAMDPA